MQGGAERRNADKFASFCANRHFPNDLKRNSFRLQLAIKQDHVEISSCSEWKVAGTALGILMQCNEKYFLHIFFSHFNTLVWHCFPCSYSERKNEPSSFNGKRQRRGRTSGFFTRVPPPPCKIRFPKLCQFRIEILWFFKEWKCLHLLELVW